MNSTDIRNMLEEILSRVRTDAKPLPIQIELMDFYSLVVKHLNDADVLPEPERLELMSRIYLLLAAISHRAKKPNLIPEYLRRGASSAPPNCPERQLCRDLGIM